MLQSKFYIAFFVVVKVYTHKFNKTKYRTENGRKGRVKFVSVLCTILEKFLQNFHLFIACDLLFLKSVVKDC
jgi:hypothetical protein